MEREACWVVEPFGGHNRPAERLRSKLAGRAEYYYASIDSLRLRGATGKLLLETDYDRGNLWTSILSEWSI